MHTSRGARARAAAGYSATELVVVAALILVLLGISLPALYRIYLRHQTDTAAVMVQSMVYRARISALKEKRAYRVVLRDENDSPPNTIELQRVDGGSFVTVSGEVHAVPGSVRILGSVPTDSVDAVTVNSRGQCNAGRVYVTSHGGRARGEVAIARTCFTESL